MPEMHPVDSTNIEAIGYDESSQELYVRFLESGDTYVYFGVEEWVFDEMMQSDSKGGYLNQEVKGSYDYTGPQ